MAELRARSGGTPIAMGDEQGGSYYPEALLLRQAVDVVRIDLTCMGGITGGIDHGGKRHGLTKFAAIHLAAVEVLDEISYESFHGSSL